MQNCDHCGTPTLQTLCPACTLEQGVYDGDIDSFKAALTADLDALIAEWSPVLGEEVVLDMLQMQIHEVFGT